VPVRCNFGTAKTSDGLFAGTVEIGFFCELIQPHWRRGYAPRFHFVEAVLRTGRRNQ